MALRWRRDNLKDFKGKKVWEGSSEDGKGPVEMIKSLQLAQADTDVLLVEQEYRVALLELGLVE